MAPKYTKYTFKYKKGRVVLEVTNGANQSLNILYITPKNTKLPILEYEQKVELYGPNLALCGLEESDIEKILGSLKLGKLNKSKKRDISGCAKRLAGNAYKALKNLRKTLDDRLPTALP